MSDYAVFASWGNDSVALVQWLHENLKTSDLVSVVYNNTGWASDEWPERVNQGKKLCAAYNFNFIELQSVGFVPLVRLKKAFPYQKSQFCTENLKRKPALDWLSRVDPTGDIICVVGIRREEGERGNGKGNRLAWPLYIENSPGHDDRSLWAPLAMCREQERDALILRAGFEILPHRSWECYPCVNSNRDNLRLVTDKRVEEIAKVEAEMGVTGKNNPITMFRPYRHMGAVGIHEVVKWAKADRGEYETPDDCDSGFCGM